MLIVAARALIVLIVLWTAAPAFARWDSTHSVIQSTAFSLEKGEFIIGVLSPIAYGASGDVTISTHPIMWILLTPNGDVRWQLFESEYVALGLTLGGAQEFGIEGAPAGHDPRAKGNFSTGAIVSFDVGAGVILSAQTGYRRHFEPDDDNVTFGGTATVLLSPAHMLMAQGGAMYSSQKEAVVSPTFKVLYAHAWENMRASVGLAYGDFPVVVDDDGDIDTINVPVWPVLDLWWRY